MLVSRSLRWTGTSGSLKRGLGRTTAWPIRWVRGPVLGMDGKAAFSVCMGSRPGEADLGDDGLSTLDRHEVAHCVITSFNSARSDPPAVLVEGWAEASQGTDPIAQAFHVWECRTRANDLTLRELTGPDWYWRHERPAYLQGGPLVNYILRRFGPERFLSLYTTCAQGTFADDCQSALGEGLDELEKGFWSDLEQIVTTEGPHDWLLLKQLKLDPTVDAAAWKRFLVDYRAAVQQLLAPYEHARTTTEFMCTTTDDHGETTLFSETHRSIRSGASHSLWIKTTEREVAYLASPSNSFEAYRKAPTGPWEIQDSPERDSDRLYRRVRTGIETEEARFEIANLLLSHMDAFKNSSIELDRVVVAVFERFIKDGRALVRVRLENRSKLENVPWRAEEFVLACDQLFAAQSFTVETRRDGKGAIHGTVDYDQHNGIPVLRGFHSRANPRDGTAVTTNLTVLERRFEQIPDEEFTAERLLTGPSVYKVVHADPVPTESTALVKWCWLPLAAGAGIAGRGSDSRSVVFTPAPSSRSRTRRYPFC